jgi:prepilin-type N-terminal cleavage/methylation domain-containing protein
MACHRTLNRGISLLELLVVIAIAASMLAVAVPSFQSRDLAGSEVRRLLADAILARSHARTTWQSATLQLDVRQGRWRPLDGNGLPLPGPQADAQGWRKFNAAVAMQKSASDFVFHPDGSMAGNASLTLVTGNSTWVIAASPLTGSLTAVARGKK